MAAQERILAHQKLLQPWVGIADAGELTVEAIEQMMSKTVSFNWTFRELSWPWVTQYSALRKSLPENVNILTLEPWTEVTYLLRLEHIFEKDEDPELSSPVTINLEVEIIWHSEKWFMISTLWLFQELFSGFTVKSAVETTLGANRELATLKSKYDWGYKETYKYPKQSLIGLEVTLQPMDIKTFIIEVSRWMIGAK